MIDYQKWSFMESWWRPYVLWLCSRSAGKTTEAAIFLQTKCFLIPNYTVWIFTNSAGQSIECFKKIEDIALQKIPSFRTCTDIFASEIERNSNSPTGFIHDPAGHHFSLFNNSGVTTLSSNLNAIRGKRGSIFYDETGWMGKEEFATTEPFASQDASWGIGVSKGPKYYEPQAMPLQRLYASSASDVTYPFYEKYRDFSKKMILGHPDYFVCDINANTILDFSTLNGEQIPSHLQREEIIRKMDEDPDMAEREYFNKFSKGGAQNSVVRMETMIRNSFVYPPVMCNDTGKRKFIFTYDPARNFDGSVLSIFELIEDEKVGLKLRYVRCISFVDTETRKKTPLPMNEQVKIIKKLLVDYNGPNAADWENIEVYIDAGAGGGGISAVADNLMEDWEDSSGQVHRGMVDPEHKQYETSRANYPNALPCIHLIEPASHKRLIFDALENMTKFDLIEFPDYDGKDVITIVNADGSYQDYELSFPERLALVQCNLAKTEITYMRKYISANGQTSYDLAKDKKNTMHDDRAYTVAMAAWVLSQKRRTDLINSNVQTDDDFSDFCFRAPKVK